MATMHTDTMHEMFLRLSPLRRLPLPVDPRIIERRWSRLLPWMLIEARKSADPANRLYILRELHKWRLDRLLQAKVTMKQIVARTLDSPIPPVEAFERALSEAVERHRARLGRVKGIRKTNRKRGIT